MESNPIIRIPTAQGDYELHWGNTLVRLFSDESFNHIEHYTDEDKIVGMSVGNSVFRQIMACGQVDKVARL